MSKITPSFLGLFAAMVEGVNATDYPPITVHAPYSESGKGSKKFGRCKFRHMVKAGYYEQQIDSRHVHPRSKRP